MATPYPDHRSLAAILAMPAMAILDPTATLDHFWLQQ